MTKWQRFVSGVKISRVLWGLAILALVKLTLLGVWAVGNLTLEGKGGELVAQQSAQSTVEEVLQGAVEAVALPEAQAQEEAEQAEGEGASMETMPAGMDPADWKVLKRREEELAAKERSLLELESSLQQEVAKLEALRVQLDALLKEVKGVEDERLQQLIKAYANMKAKQAAAVIETMDQGLAVKILAGLQGRQAGEILGFVETRKAAQLSEALTNLRVPFDQ